MTAPFTMRGIRLMLERRRYGTKTFTWLLFWVEANRAWDGYGDPWPSVVIPKKELEKAVADIKQWLSPAANHIILNGKNEGSFLGPLASPYSYKPELRKTLDGLFEAAQRSTNRAFVLDGDAVRAAQKRTLDAMRYMDESRVLVTVELEAA